MLFTLEALPARYGDALLLHYGEAGSPGLIVIDGGTSGVYRKSLRPRLDALRKSRVPDPAEPLPIRMVMVSHIDDDHIRGILDLTRDLVEDAEHSRTPPFDIATLWHNSFDDVVGNESDELAASLAAGITPASATSEFSVRPGLEISSHGALVMASVNQGRELRKSAERLAIPVNFPFDGLVAAPDSGLETVPIDDSSPGGLKLTVIGPRKGQVKKLHDDWEKELPRLLKAEAKKREELAAAFVDSSIFNLSSIVVLAEADGRRMLLTGDARGDFILEGLEAAGLMSPSGKLHVDLLKLPHHGSEHNVAPEFFQRVTADHYVVSSDGDKFKNPDVPTLRWLTEARQDAEYALHFTYPRGGFAAMFPWTEVEQLLTQARGQNPRFKAVFPEAAAAAARVELGTDRLRD